MSNEPHYVIVRVVYVRGRYVSMSEISNVVGYLPTRANIIQVLYNDMKYYKDEEYVLSMGLFGIDNITRQHVVERVVLARQVKRTAPKTRVEYHLLRVMPTDGSYMYSNVLYRI